MEEASQALISPNGLDEIVKMFGNIHNYIHPDGQLDPKWEADCLALVVLPFPLLLSWDHSKSVTQFLCHKHLTGIWGTYFATFRHVVCGRRSKVLAGALRSGRSGPVLSFPHIVGELRLI